MLASSDAPHFVCHVEQQMSRSGNSDSKGGKPLSKASKQSITELTLCAAFKKIELNAR
jgi:hypothetical protein